MNEKEVLEDANWLRVLADDIDILNEMFEQSPLFSAPEQLRMIADKIDGINQVMH